MSRFRLLPLTLVLIIAALFAACKPAPSAPPSPTAPLQPTATILPTATPATLAAWVDEAYPLTQFPANGVFVIHFSQPMLVAGQARPFSIIPEVEGTFAWSTDRMALAFTPATGELHPGKSYTLTLNRNLKTTSGNTFAVTQRWTLNVGDSAAMPVPLFVPGPTPTPAPVPPRISSRVPVGKALTGRSLEIEITFDKEMDQASVAAALAVSPEVAYTLSWKARTLTIHFPDLLAIGTSYQFTLAQTAHDTTGIPLPQENTWAYVTPGTLARATFPEGNTRDLPIAFHFNYPVTPASFATAIQIEPALAGDFTWNQAQTAATFTPREILPANTLLTFTFSRPLQMPSGETLPPPAPVRFTTPPPIVVAFPTGDSVNPSNRIQIVFDRPMDEASTAAAFHLTPETPGKITWEETTLTFTPSNSILVEYADYTVTIDATALDPNGEPVMAAPFSWAFHTVRFRAEAMFGEYGPNAQVLDADGRRAVQFALSEKGPITLHFELHRMALSQFVSRYSSGFRGVAGWETPPVIPVEGLELQTAWDEGFSGQGYGTAREVIIPETVPPGLYVFDMKTGDLINGQLILIISRYTLAVKQAERELTAWLTDIDGSSTGIPGATISVYSRDGRLIRQGVTDADGLYRTAVAQNPEPLIVVAQVGDDFTATGLSWEWNTSSYGWWNWWQPTPRARTFSAHIYTDRPIYKPGQTVSFKAILRRDQDALLSLPLAGTPVTVRIRDARNNIVTTMELLTSEFGTVHSEFAIAEGAMLGQYAIEVVWQGDSLQQPFEVQDYRKPDLQVTVTTDAPSYVAGDTITVHVDTRYFFGEPVPNAELTILQFVRSQGYYDWWRERYVEGENWIEPWDSKPLSGITGENGQYTFTLPASLFWGGDYSSWGWPSSQARNTWGIEVTADDGSHQTVSGVGAVTVYANIEEITVDTGGYFKIPSEAFPLEAAVHDIHGSPVEGRTLAVELRRWSNETNDYTSIAQAAQMVTGPDGEASLNFTPESPGYYQLRVSSTDARGKPIEYHTWLYVFRDASLWMRGDQFTNLRITAEQNTYAPGETARLVIESSFSGPALLTFERGTVREELPIRLTAPLTVLDVPIRADYAPNIFIVVNAYHPLATTLENQHYLSESIPDSKLHTASVEVQVPAADKSLIVTITPDKAGYAPREEATFTVRVTNQNGIPVSAEVSLALVDEAIFSLSEELSGPIFASFYDPRPHIVRTYDSLALRRILYSGGMGGGGGDGILPGNPRRDFPDTAAWFPVLKTNEKGEIVVTLSLPDTLTTWRLTAKAATGSSHKFGEATAKFLTQQPIIVRPILPRTLTTGDQVLLSAMVHNYSDKPRQLQITISLGEEPLLQLENPSPQTLTLAPGEQRMVGWTATALAAGEANITITAATPAGDPGDAVQLSLPIRPLAIPDVTTLVGDFTGAYAAEILWPGDALGISTVEIELSRSIAGTLLAGLEYLTGFPYGCVEQTMSKALPNAVVGRALHQLGISDPTLQSDLPAQINAGLQRLYGYQHNDGGWGWWYDDATHDYQTAWVVFGLAVTAQAGYEVDPGVIERGAAWLNEHLSAMDVRTQAFALYALAISGHGNLEAAQDLYASSFAQLDTFSRASLALAFHALGEAGSAQAIVDTLAETATQRNSEVYWAGEDYDGYYYEKTMASATRATALALSAFVQIRPHHPLEPGLVRWLMGQRTQHGWGTTNETSFAILALTDHLLAAEFATAQTTYQIELNGTVIASGSLGPGEPAASLEIPAAQLRAGTNALTLRQTGSLPLYYMINSRAYLPQSEVPAAGLVRVTRQYLDPATNKPLDTAQPGQLVKVVLTVSLPDTASYMLVEDQLPGGLEALNENLNTTSHVADAVDANGEAYEAFFWRELGYNYKEIRAGRVTFFITEMSAGAHTFTYLARATHSGTFVAMPAEAYAMYDLATWGRSASAVVVVGK